MSSISISAPCRRATAATRLSPSPLPGVWRLRMPLPWPGVPHGNAFAVAAGDGIVLFDTGYADSDGTRQLELALAQVDRIRRNAHDQADSHAALVRLLERHDIDAAYEFLVQHLADAQEEIIEALQLL